MTYIISDIHAQYELFMRLMDRIGFSGGDTLISCGDMIDKGEDSVRLLGALRNLPGARCIIGNHEYEFLQYYWNAMRTSPEDFDLVLNSLREYPGGDGRLLDWETVDWLESLPYFIEEKDFLCVHAGLPVDEDGRPIPPEKASCEQLVYDRNFKDPRFKPRGKCVFFGHTPTSYILPDGRAEIIAYRRDDAPPNPRNITDFCKVHLDMGAWLNGVLGCFCIENCTAYYVKKQ